MRYICRDHFREIMGPTRSSVVPVVRRRGELDASVGAGMRIFRLALCGLAAAVMLNASAARADIRIDDYLRVWITNEITDQDANEFEKQIPVLVNYPRFHVRLDSPGGSVAAAIRIGRLVRKFDGDTTIETNARCYSSCALIFIAGVYRVNAGELGLHRPYLAAQPLEAEAVRQQAPKMYDLVKGYVSEMGIGDLFYQQMMNTEPSKLIRYRNQLPETLLPHEDPVYEEVVIAQAARSHGVTTTEYRRRLAQDDLCDKDKSFRFADCGEAVMWGLASSAPVFYERKIKAAERCSFSGYDPKEKGERWRLIQKFSPQDQAILDRTRSALQADLPFVRKYDDCVLEVMLGR
jgi:hypothetical protein